MTNKRVTGTHGSTTLDMLYYQYPWLKDLVGQNAAKLLSCLNALEYISCPTLGYDGSKDILEFIEKDADPEMIKQALITCVDLARRVKEGCNGQ